LIIDNIQVSAVDAGRTLQVFHVVFKRIFPVIILREYAFKSLRRRMILHVPLRISPEFSVGRRPRGRREVSCTLPPRDGILRGVIQIRTRVTLRRRGVKVISRRRGDFAAEGGDLRRRGANLNSRRRRVKNLTSVRRGDTQMARVTSVRRAPGGWGYVWGDVEEAISVAGLLSASLRAHSSPLTLARFEIGLGLCWQGTKLFFFRYLIANDRWVMSSWNLVHVYIRGR
jgi:hypothetical protein